MKIKKIFIANRGEIVCRIARTADRMGIQVSGALTPQDFHTAAARVLDHADVLPPGDLSQNYLNQEMLIELALRHQAQAIHPGYGFLSENPEFAEKVQKAGLIWIGPPPKAMRELGGKIEAKQVAQKARVPVAPWKRISKQPSQKEFQEWGHEIGFPVLIKAAHGGGGRGQRVVRQAKEFEEALRAARSEALRSFGSDEVFVERFLDRPHHIEVQIIADQHGHLIQLGERDCTLQRRNQKVVEETPATVLDTSTRKKIQNAAVTLAKAVGYTNAGTIEFLAQKNKKGWEFYFMEMNARLQVEHTVTESVCGVDLVEWQIRIAQGENMEKEFASLKGPSGHALEVRLCAENPENHFLPTPGPLVAVSFPSVKDFRVDSGYEAGDTVPQEYDSLIAKLIFRSSDRKRTIQNLIQMLQRTVVSGVITNKFFLEDILSHSDFKLNRVYTRWIEDHPELTQNSNALDEDLAYWGRKWSSELFVQRKVKAPEIRLRTYENPDPKYLLRFIPDEELHGSHTLQGLVQIAGDFEVDGGSNVKVSGWINRFELCITFGSRVREVGQRKIRFLGELELEDIRTHHGPIVSQVPGVVLEVRSKVKDIVQARTPILIIEAMKIEMPMSLPVDAKITSINVKSGDRILPGQTLVTWEPVT
jgi:acetyl/propionyl-CoA carboxylase alpha subunit